MSLAQRVTFGEGFDYEGPGSFYPQPPPSELGFDDPRPVRRQRPVEEVEQVEDESDVSAEAQPLLARPRPSTPTTVIETDLEPPSWPPKWRPLSYDAFTGWRFPKPRLRTGAYSIPKKLRVLQVTTAVVACWLAGGIIYGFAAFKPILIDEGIFSDMCEDEDVVPCVQQDMYLNFVFLVGCITSNLSSLVAAACLERCGRRVCWLGASIFLCCGSFLMAMTFSFPSFHGLIARSMFLSMGGTFLFIASFELVCAFPLHTELVTMLITGAFDASSSVFALYRLAYETLGRETAPLVGFWCLYLLVPILIIMAEVMYMPNHPYHTILELEGKVDRAGDPNRDRDPDDEDLDAYDIYCAQSVRADARHAKLALLEAVCGSHYQRLRRTAAVERAHRHSRVWGVLHGAPLVYQLHSPWFLLLVSFVALQMLRINYFIATVRGQYAVLLGSDALADRVTTAFNFALPLGTVVVTPFLGRVLNLQSTQRVCTIMTLLLAANTVMGCLPAEWAAYLTIATAAVFRPLFFSAVTDYAVKVFGVATFGRIHGVVVCVATAVSLLQPGLDALVQLALGGDPLIVNAVLGGVGTLLGGGLTLYVAVAGRLYILERREKERAANAAAYEHTRRLIEIRSIRYGQQW